MTVHIKYVLNKITFFFHKKGKKGFSLNDFLDGILFISGKMDCRMEFQGRYIFFNVQQEEWVW